MTNCIFCKIINSEIPSAKVYEDEKVFAFLDMSQVTPGHTLVIPKKHVQDIFEMDAETASELFQRVPKIASAIEKAFPNLKGLNMVNNNRELAYQTVFHAHVHLIPRFEVEEGFEMRFDNNQANYTPEEFAERANKIAEHLI